MSAPKLLNLDDLPTTAPERVIVLKGTRHEMKPLSVGDFIDQQRAAAAANPQDTVAASESYINLIHSVFPTLAVDDLRRMTFDRLGAILAFISKRADEIVAQAQAAEPVAEGDGKN